MYFYLFFCLLFLLLIVICIFLYRIRVNNVDSNINLILYGILVNIEIIYFDILYIIIVKFKYN